MPGTYRMIELVGTSPVSFAEAVKVAINEASSSVQHMDWFEVNLAERQDRGRLTA